MIATMRGEDFNRIIQATKRFVSKDTERGLLAWIRLEFSKESQSVKAIAVDGFRIATESSLCDSVEDDFSICVKPNIRNVSKSETIIIKLDDEKAFIKDGETILGYVQPDGEFINYEKIINDIVDKPIIYEIAFNGNLLIEALQSAKVSKGDFRESITLEFRNEESPIIIRTGADNIKLVLPMRKRN